MLRKRDEEMMSRRGGQPPFGGGGGGMAPFGGGGPPGGQQQVNFSQPPPFGQVNFKKSLDKDKCESDAVDDVFRLNRLCNVLKISKIVLLSI